MSNIHVYYVALNFMEELWHKSDRFADQLIAMFDAQGPETLGQDHMKLYKLNFIAQ